jgi:phosphatidate cytidylyltransferase
MPPEASAAAKKRGLLVRLTVAPLVLGGALALLGWHDRSGSAWPADAILVVLGAGASFECAAMLRAGGAPASLPLVVAMSVVLTGMGVAFPHDAATRQTARAVALGAAVLLAFVQHFRAAREDDLPRLLGTVFPIVYVGFLFAMLRDVGDGPDGARRLALVIVASKASDIGGWLVGKTLGRHKMIPSVSPGKTWEGTVGGLLFSVGGAILVERAVGPLPGLASGPADAAALGALLGAVAILAGLTHSALKRRCGVKDSSTLLPEMGGLLDMVDSLLFAGPAAWVWQALR